MKLTGHNFIGFERSGNGKVHFQAKNPESQESLETIFFEATTKEIDQAVTKAEGAFLTYKSIKNNQRAAFLEAIGDELLALGDTLINRCKEETALPEARLNGERMRTVNQLKLFAGVVREGSWVDARIDTALPDRQPLPKPDVRQLQVPLGPVGIFGASNFPLAFSVAGGDTASALAAGCPVLVKAHPLHPGTSEMVGQAIINAAQKTGMPDGVFSLVQGTSVDVGMAMVNHPKITAIGFTGSFGGGKALWDAANKREVPIPVFAEMGSSNPVFILPGALSDRNDSIAAGMISSLNLGVGQFCTNPGLVITNVSEDSTHLIEKMKKLATESAAGTMLSAGIKSNYEKGATRLSANHSTELVATGRAGTSVNNAETRLYQTTGQNFIAHPELAEEVFGPTTLHIASEDKNEMLKIAENLEGHLTATIHGTEDDLKVYEDLIAILERKVGRLIFNGYPTGVEVCHSMVHGGPYPATTAPQSTSVGTAAIKRFARPVCYQDFPQTTLPEPIKDGNPLSIWRMVNGQLGKD
ncbi:MAG: aldehyde dehydrogenase (NADP(+)) [Marinoscillum sp.]